VGILSRSLLNAAFDGRVTFMVAGAVLGVGIYGFAVTFKPYESGRVMQSFRVPTSALVASSEPVIEPPSSVLPDVTAAAQAADPPPAPGPVQVSVPVARLSRRSPWLCLRQYRRRRRQRGRALPPVPEKPAPRGIGPIEIAPENVLVYIYPPRRSEKDATDGAGSEVQPDAASPWTIMPSRTRRPTGVASVTTIKGSSS
jgi:hypothetical protein